MMSLIHYLLLVMSFLQITWFGTAVKIEIKPVTFDGVIPKSVNITCTPEDARTCNKKILTIQVTRTGDRPMVTLEQNSEITYNRLLRKNIQAEGQIDKEATGKSRLTVTFSGVVKEDSGQYSCVMVYLDPWGYMQQEEDTDDLVVDGHNMHDVLRYLVGKLSSMEQLVQQQQKYSPWVAEERMGELSEQKNKTVDLEKRLEELEKVVKKQNDAMNDCQSKTGVQGKYIRELKDFVEEREEEASFMAAFSYGYDSIDKIITGAPIKFRKQILDVGGHYDVTSGKFTAPRDGYYVFHLIVKSHHNGGQVMVYLMARDGDIVGLLDVVDKSYHDQSSVSTVVLLDEGDCVWPQVRYNYGTNVIHAYEHQSFFTGYLLKLT